MPGPSPRTDADQPGSAREAPRRPPIRRVRLRRPAALRQSHIARADNCMLSLRFDLESRQRQSGTQMGLLAARGTLFHRFAAVALEHMRDHSERSIPVEMAMELLTAVISQADVPDEDYVLLPMRELRWLRVLAVKWAHRTEFSIERIVAVERRLEAPIEYLARDGTRKTVMVTGQPDVLLTGPGDDEATLIDWKTGFAPPAKRVRRDGQATGDRLSDVGYVQQVVYGWLVMRNYSTVERVHEREFYVLADDDPVREAAIERWELERIEDVLSARVSGIMAALDGGKRSKRWFPVAGAHCAMCPRPTDCPIREEVGIPTTEAEAQDLVREWFAAGAIRKEREPLAKGWVDAHGPVEIDHAKGRRMVGWVPNKTGSGRTFKLYEPEEADESPFDADLEAALSSSLRERGLEPVA